MFAINLCQFLRNLLVENFADGERFDGSALFALETINFKHGIASKFKADEIAKLPIFTKHHGFKCVNVRAANLIRLLDLDGIPFICEFKFTFGFAATFWHCAHRINASINSHRSEEHTSELQSPMHL